METYLASFSLAFSATKNTFDLYRHFRVEINIKHSAGPDIHWFKHSELSLMA